MSNAITTTFTTMSPPGHTKVPNELWLKIFSYLLALSPTTYTGNIINISLSKTLWAMGPLSRLRKVSKHFSRLALIVFYNTNIFKFTAVDHGTYLNYFGNYLAPLLPPLHLRPSLRHIQLTLFLGDSWDSLNVGNDNSLTEAHKFFTSQVADARELLVVCPGARMLHRLCKYMTGLKVLDLHLIVGFCGIDNQRAVEIYRQAGFEIKAKTVNLVMTDYNGQGEGWHPELAKAIGL